MQYFCMTDEYLSLVDFSQLNLFYYNTKFLDSDVVDASRSTPLEPGSKSGKNTGT